MNRVKWRWEERDFGFRFRSGRGRQAGEYYQARSEGEFYIVPGSQRKCDKKRMEGLAKRVSAPTPTRVVASPWRDYAREWDWIVTEDGLCLNWAGCLDKEEISRREDEGVQRGMVLVIELAQRDEPVPLSLHLIRQIHVELLGAIYPFAGAGSENHG